MSNIIDIHQNGEELDIVDYEKESTEHFSIFSNSQVKTLLLSLLFYFILEGSYVFTAVKSPPYVNTTTFFYPITHDESPTAADVFVHVEKLTNLHKFFRMDGVVVRRFLNNSASDPLEIFSAINYEKNGKITRSINTSKTGKPLRYTCKFEHGAEFSNRFLIINEPIHNFDSLNISLLINSTNFESSKVTGFNFRYSFAQPNLLKYANSIKIIFTISSLVVFIDYVRSLYSKNKTIFEQNSSSNYIFSTLLLSLGFTAIFALNPLEIVYFWLNINRSVVYEGILYKILTALSPILFSLFMTIFKLFTYYLIDTTIHNSEDIDKQWAMFYGIFIIFFEIIETLAGLQNSDIYKNIIKTGSLSLDGYVNLTLLDRILMTLQLVYCITTLLLLAYSYRVSNKNNKMKFISYGLFIFLSLIMTLSSEVFLSSLKVTKHTSISLLFYQTAHILSSIIFYLFQDADTSLFESINDKDQYHSNNADNGISPDIESDNENNVKFEAIDDIDNENNDEDHAEIDENN